MARNEVPQPDIRWALIAWGVLCTLGNFWFSCTEDRWRSTPELFFPRAPSLHESIRFGFLAGQVAWIAICSVLPTWSLCHRCLYCFIAASATVLSCTASEWYRQPSFQWEPSFPVLLSLPVIILAIQSPFWALRTWAGWRLVQPSNDSSKDHAQPLGVRDLLGATTCVALALCALRLSVAPNSLANGAAEFTVACGMLALISLFAAVSAAALILRPSRTDTAVCLTGIYQVCLFGLSFGLMYYLLCLPPFASGAQRALFIMVFGAAFFLTLDFPLFVARRLGWRLHWQ